MSDKFNENTRVQVPAAMHLCRLGYAYLDDIRLAELNAQGAKLDRQIAANLDALKFARGAGEA